MEEPRTPDPAPVAPAYLGGPLSLDDMIVELRRPEPAAHLAKQTIRQMASVAHGAAKRHGNWRYERGYAHGRSDFDREGPLPDVDDPRDEQTEKIARAIRACAETPMSAEEWAAALYDCGIRAIDLPGGCGDDWQAAVAAAKAADAAYLAADAERAAEMQAAVEEAGRDRIAQRAAEVAATMRVGDSVRRAAEEHGLPYEALHHAVAALPPSAVTPGVNR